MLCTVASLQEAVVKRMLIIAIVSLALGVILGLTVPAHPVDPEAVGLSEVVGTDNPLLLT